VERSRGLSSRWERSRGLPVENSLASTRSSTEPCLFKKHHDPDSKEAHTELKTMGVSENLVDIDGSSHVEMKTVRIDEKTVDMRGSSHCVITRRRDLYHSALTSHRIENIAC
jgi:hypothetical protein